MKAIIIEDEMVAVKNLNSILNEVAPDINIIGVLDSVKSAVNYFRQNEMPDLVFADIQLADGESFSIFKEVEITCPVIFTTAFDSYALEAFKVNSIDYLLKPIEPEHVKRALNKLSNLSSAELRNYVERISQVIPKEADYIKTFLVNYRDKLIPVTTSQIAFLYTKNETVNLTTFEGKEWVVEYTLETIMSKLNPTDFFRANRQFIIAHRAVKEVIIWFGNRLAVNLVLPTKERIIISKARVSSFKKWLIKN